MTRAASAIKRVFKSYHISPRFPKVKPIQQKKANSASSLHSDGIEFNARIIRLAI